MSDLLASILGDDDATPDEIVPGEVLAFQIKKFVLQALLEKAITVVPTRDVMPVLKCFKFDLDDSNLRVIASDLEMTLIATTTMITPTTPGISVFPARK